MGLVANREFYDERIDLTGSYWYGCYFDGCVLVCNDDQPTGMRFCHIKDSLLEGNGWPEPIITLRLDG